MVSRADDVYSSKGAGLLDRSNYLNNSQALPAAASVIMTKYCNFKCKHCNVDAGPDQQETMSLGLAKKMVDEVSDAGIPLLILSGGEITLKPDLLIDTLRHAKEIGYTGTTIVQTNGTFAAGRSDGKAMDFLESLKQAGADGIEITSDDSYHGKSRRYIERAKKISEDIFGCENVSTYGVRDPVVPVGRALREVPRSEWSVGDKKTFWNDNYNMHNLVKIDVDGSVYSCPWMSVKIGDLNETPLNEIIETARSGIAGEISKHGGFAKLDPEGDLGISRENFDSLIEELGECGACHEYFGSVNNGKGE